MKNNKEILLSSHVPVEFRLSPKLRQKMTLDQLSIWNYYAELYRRILLKEAVNRKFPDQELKYYEKSLEFYVEFMTHPERFKPTHLAWVSAAGEVIKTLKEHTESASTSEGRRIAREVYEKVQSALWKALPQNTRQELERRGKKRLEGTSLWAENLQEIDRQMQEEGQEGVVEIVKRIVPFDIKTRLEWGRALRGDQKVPIIRDHYSLKLPYTWDGWGNVKPKPSTYQFERGGILSSLEDWVEHIPSMNHPK